MVQSSQQYLVSLWGSVLLIVSVSFLTFSLSLKVSHCGYRVFCRPDLLFVGKCKLLHKLLLVGTLYGNCICYLTSWCHCYVLFIVAINYQVIVQVSKYSILHTVHSTLRNYYTVGYTFILQTLQVVFIYWSFFFDLPQLLAPLYFFGFYGITNLFKYYH